MGVERLTRLVKTKTSTYLITVISPLDLEILVQGGRRFATPTRARLLRQDRIAVGEELRLQVGRRKVVTTRVVEVEVL